LKILEKIPVLESPGKVLENDNFSKNPGKFLKERKSPGKSHGISS
jgi:hypothetical protein